MYGPFENFVSPAQSENFVPFHNMKFSSTSGAGGFGMGSGIVLIRRQSISIKHYIN